MCQIERISNNDVQTVVVRINGVLPNISTPGSNEKSERAAQIKQQDRTSNTSCSLFALSETNQIIFHMQVDIGQGIVKTIENGISSLGFKSTTLSLSVPDAVLITHSHDDHIKELPI